MITDSIFCLLLSTSDKKILFPASAIAEVIPYQHLKRVDNVPEWLLGLFAWRGLQIPLIKIEKRKHPSLWRDSVSFEEENILKSFVAVIHRSHDTLESQQNKQYHPYPFLGILLSKIPNTLKVYPTDLMVQDLELAMEQSYWIPVILKNENVLMPNFLALWNTVDALPSRLQWFKQ